MPRKPQKKCYSQRGKGIPFLKGYNIHHDPTDPAAAVDTESDPSTSETTKTTGPKRPVGAREVNDFTFPLGIFFENLFPGQTIYFKHLFFFILSLFIFKVV